MLARRRCLPDLALADALRRRDYLSAHEIDLRIRALEEALASTSGTLPQPSFSEVLRESLSRALGGGVAGAAAMSVQVLTLMWLRTTLYYQYRCAPMHCDPLAPILLMLAPAAPLVFYV